MLVRASPFIAALFLFAGFGAASAQPFRCVDAAGKVTYTDQRCPDSHQQKKVDIVDNSADATELRRAIDGRKDAPLPVPSGAQSLRTEAAPDDPRNCPTRKRDYEIAANSIKKELPAVERRYADAVRACGLSLARLDAHEKLAGEARKERRRAHALLPW